MTNPKPGTCAACHFSMEAPPNPMDLAASRQLTCWRYPPSVALLPTPNGPVGMSIWPNVQPGQVCGEYLDRPSAGVVGS